jgi:hypothetical protein
VSLLSPPHDNLGSPFVLDIVDATSVSVYGDQLRTASVGKLTTFTIHAQGADVNDLSVTILGRCEYVSADIQMHAPVCRPR